MKKILIGFVLMTLAGCATTPKTPQQAVYQLESEYQVALAAAVAYKSLPACGPGAPLVCSDAGVVAKLKQADVTASTAIFAAQTAVRDPTFDKSKTDAVMVAATQALNVLTAIVAQTKGAK